MSSPLPKLSCEISLVQNNVLIATLDGLGAVSQDSVNHWEPIEFTLQQQLLSVSVHKITFKTDPASDLSFF